MAIGRDTSFTWLGHSAVEVRTPGRQGRSCSTPGSPTRRARARRRAAASCDLLLRDPRALRPHRPTPCRSRARLRPAWPCIHELSLWLSRRLPGGAEQVIGMNKGGTVEVDGRAGHDGPAPTTRPATGTRAARRRSTSGEPAGFVRGARERVPDLRRRRHAGVRRHGADPRAVPPDLAMLPIGGHFTMDPAGAALAVGAPGRPATSCRSTGARSRS